MLFIDKSYKKPGALSPGPRVNRNTKQVIFSLTRIRKHCITLKKYQRSLKDNMGVEKQFIFPLTIRLESREMMLREYSALCRTNLVKKS